MKVIGFKRQTSGEATAGVGTGWTGYRQKPNRKITAQLATPDSRPELGLAATPLLVTYWR